MAIYRIVDIEATILKEVPTIEDAIKESLILYSNAIDEFCVFMCKEDFRKTIETDIYSLLNKHKIEDFLRIEEVI